MSGIYIQNMQMPQGELGAVPVIIITIYYHVYAASCLYRRIPWFVYFGK